MTLILPPGEPKRGDILDANGDKLKSFERHMYSDAKLYPLDEHGEINGDPIHLPNAEIVIWT